MAKPKIIAVPCGKRFKFGVLHVKPLYGKTLPLKSIRSWDTARAAIAAGRSIYKDWRP